MFFYSESESPASDGWNLQLRQTWEVGDVDHSTTGDLTYRITDGTSATVVNHSSLSNNNPPKSVITTGGEKCVYINSAHRAYQHQRMYWTRSDLVGTPERTAVSLRILARNQWADNAADWTLMMRGRNDGNYDGGYIFGVGPSSLRATGAGSIEGWGTHDNEWHRFRFDMIPQVENGVVTGDLLVGYVADGNEAIPNWQLKFQSVQTSIPASHPTYRYHQLKWHDHSNYGQSQVFWIDDFEIYTKEV